MGIYAKTVRVQLTAAEYKVLVALAQKKGVTVGDVVRELLVQTLESVAHEGQKAALDRLLALDAPSPDWPQMEAEIEHGLIDSERVRPS